MHITLSQNQYNRERTRYTTNYPDTQLVKMLVRHVVTVNNLRAMEADPKKDRVGGRQPGVRVAPQGPAQAQEFAALAQTELPPLLGGEFAIVGLTRSRALRTKVTSEVVRDAWGLTLPIEVDNDLAELHKGFRWCGGHQGCLRSTVQTDTYRARRAEEGWDFRYGRPEYNRLGLHVLSQAETEREVGTRVLRWINHKPPVPERLVATGLPLIDVGFGHGMSGTRGIAMALHGNDPLHVGITVREAEQHYSLHNASGFVLTHDPDGDWEERGRIILPEHQVH